MRSPTARWARRRTLAAALSVVGLLGAACGHRDTTEPRGPEAAPTPEPDTTVTPMSPSDAPRDPLATDLARGAFGDLFNYAARDAAVDAIWGQPDSLARLEAIVRDPDAPAQARFLACEVLFDKHLLFIGDVGEDTVARIYAEALVNDRTGNANTWGLLYEHDDQGPVGIRFAMIGEESLAALRPLLDDASTPLTYEGSEAATVGNAYRFRVKDFAAYYIAKMKRIPIAFHQDTAARDREIEALKQKL